MPNNYIAKNILNKLHLLSEMLKYFYRTYHPSFMEVLIFRHDEGLCLYYYCSIVYIQHTILNADRIQDRVLWSSCTRETTLHQFEPSKTTFIWCWLTLSVPCFFFSLYHTGEHLLFWRLWLQIPDLYKQRYIF